MRCRYMPALLVAEQTLLGSASRRDGSACDGGRPSARDGLPPFGRQPSASCGVAALQTVTGPTPRLTTCTMYSPRPDTVTSMLAMPFDDFAVLMTLPSGSSTATAKGADVLDSASTSIDFAFSGTNSSSGSDLPPVGTALIP